MKTILKSFLGALFAFILLFVILFIVVIVMMDTEPKVSANSYLHLKIRGSIPEYVTPDPFGEALGQKQLDVKKIRDDLEKAAVDERINGVILDVSLASAGYAKLEEIHQLIREYRKSGKKIYAYLGGDITMAKDYFLATACDSIFMPPTATLYLTGIRAEITFYRDFFRKVGVEAQFVHVGDYKNAPDVYTRREMSEQQREELQRLIDYWYQRTLSILAESRGLEAEQIDRFINEQTGFSGQTAMEAGLIDTTGFFNDVEALMNIEDKSATQLSALDYADIPASSLDIRNKSRIAVINCVGTIASGSEADDPVMGKLMGAKTIISNIDKAAASSSVKAIILRINSPGGSTQPSVDIWDAVIRAREKKPVIASISDYGASGGYYIAMAADTMIAAPSSLVGSVGIFAGKFNFSGLYDKLDLNSESISRGEHSALFSIVEPWSPSEKAIVLRVIEEFYEDFVAKVAVSRGLPLDEVRNLAGGRVYTGEEAVANGLFDLTGGFYTSVEVAREMAGLDSVESVRLVYYPREKSLLNQLMGTTSAKLKLLNSHPLMAAETFIDFVEQIQNRPLALLPFRLEVN